MKHEPISPAEARAALDQVDAARARLAEVGVCPPWRHAAFGAVMALLVGGAGFGASIQSACTPIALCGIALIAAYDRRRYGVFINGYRRGATLGFTIGLLLTMLGLLVAQIWLREEHVAIAVRLAITAAAFILATAGSVVWSRIFRRELGRA